MRYASRRAGDHDTPFTMDGTRPVGELLSELVGLGVPADAVGAVVAVVAFVGERQLPEPEQRLMAAASTYLHHVEEQDERRALDDLVADVEAVADKLHRRMSAWEIPIIGSSDPIRYLAQRRVPTEDTLVVTLLGVLLRHHAKGRRFSSAIRAELLRDILRWARHEKGRADAASLKTDVSRGLGELASLIMAPVDQERWVAFWDQRGQALSADARRRIRFPPPWP